MKAKICICILTAIVLLFCSCNVSTSAVDTTDSTGTIDSTNETTDYLGSIYWDDVYADSVEDFLKEISLKDESFDDISIPYGNVLDNDNIIFSSYQIKTVGRAATYLDTGEYRGDKSFDFYYHSVDCELTYHDWNCTEFYWHIYYDKTPISKVPILENREPVPNIKEDVYESKIYKNGSKSYVFFLKENCYSLLNIQADHKDLDVAFDQWLNYCIHVKSLLNNAPIAE